MRKLVLIVLIACLVAIVLYLGIGADNYFLLRLGDWAIQMRLVVALLLGLVLLVVVILGWKLFRGTLLGAWPKAWKKNRQHARATNVLESLAKSDWSSAQKEFVRLANQSDNPAACVVNAATCAFNAGNYAQARAIYESALGEMPDWSNVIKRGLFQLELVEGDIDQAESILKELQNMRFPNVELQRMEAELAEEKRDWPRLQKLLLSARKKFKAGSPLAAIERRYLFNRILEEPKSQALLDFSRFLDGAQCVPAAVVADTTSQLVAQGYEKEAEALLRKNLSKKWDDSLIAAYSDIQIKSPKKQLKTAEAWLDTNPESEPLIRALHSLALRANDGVRVARYSAMLDASAESALALA